MAGNLERADRHELVALEMHDGDVAVEEIADVEVAAIRAERHALGQPAELGFHTLRTFLPSIFKSDT